MDASGDGGRYELILESIPTLVWVAGPDGAIEYLNRPCLEYVGLPMGDLLGWDWRKVIHPADLPRTLARWERSLASGDPLEVDYRLLRHDGAYRWFVARARPLAGPCGRPAKWFGTCTDVDAGRQADAARRSSEGLFRAIVEGSYEAFALLGANRTVRYVSPAVAAILGHTPEEFVGPDFLDWAHPDARPGLGAWFSFLLGRAGERVEVSYRFRHRDGNYRRLEVRAANRLCDPDVGAVVVNFWGIDGPRPARG